MQYPCRTSLGTLLPLASCLAFFSPAWADPPNVLRARPTRQYPEFSQVLEDEIQVSEPGARWFQAEQRSLMRRLEAGTRPQYGEGSTAKEHSDRLRQSIREAIVRAPMGQPVVVLGAGLLRDMPDELFHSEKFPSIILVDVNLDAMRKGVQRRGLQDQLDRGRIRIIEADLSMLNPELLEAIDTTVRRAANEEEAIQQLIALYPRFRHNAAGLALPSELHAHQAGLVISSMLIREMEGVIEIAIFRHIARCFHQPLPVSFRDVELKYSNSHSGHWSAFYSIIQQVDLSHADLLSTLVSDDGIVSLTTSIAGTNPEAFRDETISEDTILATLRQCAQLLIDRGDRKQLAAALLSLGSSPIWWYISPPPVMNIRATCWLRQMEPLTTDLWVLRKDPTESSFIQWLLLRPVKRAEPALATRSSSTPAPTLTKTALVREVDLLTNHLQQPMAYTEGQAAMLNVVTPAVLGTVLAILNRFGDRLTEGPPELNQRLASGLRELDQSLGKAVDAGRFTAPVTQHVQDMRKDLFALLERLETPNAVVISGSGLQRGVTVTYRISPGAPGSGILIRRTDASNERQPHRHDIAVHEEFVTNADKVIVLYDGTEAFAGPEHLLSAEYAFGIDNVVNAVDNFQAPVMANNAVAYAEAFAKTPWVAQTHEEPFTITKPLIFQDAQGRITHVLLPYDGLYVGYLMDFPVLGRKYEGLEVTPQTYQTLIAPARNFVFEKDHPLELIQEYLSDPEAPIVVGRQSILTPAERLSVPEDPALSAARHKILDLLGDLRVARRRIRGRLFAFKTGHLENHHVLVRQLDEVIASGVYPVLGQETVVRLQQQLAVDFGGVLPHDLEEALSQLTTRLLPLRGQLLKEEIGVRDFGTEEPAVTTSEVLDGMLESAEPSKRDP